MSMSTLTSTSTVSVANLFLVSDAFGWTTSQFSIDRRLFTLNCQLQLTRTRLPSGLVGHLRVVSFARWVVSGRAVPFFLGPHRLVSPGLDVYQHIYRTCRPTFHIQSTPFKNLDLSYRDSVPFRRLIGLESNWIGCECLSIVVPPITFPFCNR